MNLHNILQKLFFVAIPESKVLRLNYRQSLFTHLCYHECAETGFKSVVTFLCAYHFV